MQHKKKSQVEITLRDDALKKKVNPQQKAAVFIHPSDIEKAQSVIENCSALVDKEIDVIIQNIISLLKKMHAKPNTENKHIATMLYIYTNRAFDISSMFKLEVISYFTELFRDFLEQADFENATNLKMVQIYTDIISLAHKGKIQMQDEEEVAHLKYMMHKAMENTMKPVNS